MIQKGEDENTDVYCIQEAQHLDNKRAYLAAKGYELHTHGRVAIITRNETAGRYLKDAPWRGYTDDDNPMDAMSITLSLNDNKDSLQIFSVYIPTGQDDKSNAEKELAENIHMAVKAQSLETDHAIITMDSNETMTTEGRKCFPLDIDDEGFKEELSTTETKEQTDKLRTEQPTEKTTASEDEPKIRPAREQDETILKSMTSMACYAVTMIDIHQELNPQLYQEGEPKRGAYTNVTRLPDQRKAEAKIDYAWATMDIGGRITECRLLEDTKTWGKNITYRNYHRAIVMKIKWKGIWTGTRQPEGENYNMLGSISEAGLNMDRLDQGMKRDISKEVNTAFEKNLEVRRTILGSGRTDKQKLELLYAQFQSTVMKVGKRRLGRRKRNSKERKKNGGREEKWRGNT